MFCNKCGAKIEDNAKFCVKCGQPVQGQKTPEYQGNFLPDIPIGTAEQENNVTTSKEHGHGKRLIGIILLLLLIVALIGVIGYLGYSMIDRNTRQEEYSGYMKQAASCYDDEDFEGAEGYYLKALDCRDDDTNVYIGLAKTYVALEDEQAAINILENGYEKTKSTKLQDMLKDLQKDKSQETEAEEDNADETESDSEKEKYDGPKKDVSIEIRQVDTSKFPEVTLYASIVDEDGNTVEKMQKDDFNIQEIDVQGNVKKASIDDVYQVLNEDNINVNLVLDASGSMSSYSKMPQAKAAAEALINQMNLTAGDKVEIISFDDYVYLEQEFSGQQDILVSAIEAIGTGGATALYDALYAGLYQTYYETGAKCVIGFTDGEENCSSYTFDDVVNMAQNTGIPVFIIGIGDEYDSAALQELASLCSGRYYSADVTDLETILEDIYISIYREQQDYYVLKYTSENMDNLAQFRDVVVETSEYTEFSGSYRKSYVPQADISGAFSDSYMNMDFMIDDSDVREITANDLTNMSLAQLRIARNEIFARHGRQFKDSMLNQWFYSKTWYLNISSKYAPDEFDALRPSPMSQLELQNANFIKSYEDALMQQRDIYPDAESVLLTDYDLALSKVVLKKAYQQMQGYSSSSVLEQNRQLVLDAINKEDVVY